MDLPEAARAIVPNANPNTDPALDPALQPTALMDSAPADSVQIEYASEIETTDTEAGDDFGDFGDVFDFDSPDFDDAGVAHVPLEPKPVLRQSSKQDEIFSLIALEVGVTDVMLSTREGQLLGAKVSRLDAPKLCLAVSKLAAGADGGIPPGLIYMDIGEQWVNVAPLDDQVLLTVLCASNTNIGKLLAQIVNIREGL
jgi:hypothetical protein